LDEEIQYRAIIRYIPPSGNFQIKRFGFELMPWTNFIGLLRRVVEFLEYLKQRDWQVKTITFQQLRIISWEMKP